MIRRIIMLGGIFGISIWGASLGWATTYFTQDAVLYFLRRIPIVRCSETQVPKSGYNCVSNEDYEVLAAGMPRGVSVGREFLRVEIPPFATKLCAISTSQLRSKTTQRESEALGAGERPHDLLPWVAPDALHCSGYLPFVQESGLDEEDGRLYLFLHEQGRFRSGRTLDRQEWDTYLWQGRHPRILELPVRGDRVLNFLRRRLNALETSDAQWRKILVEQHAGLTLPELKPGEMISPRWVDRYQAAKGWQALHYLYAALLEAQGIPPHAFETMIKTFSADTPWFESVQKGQWTDARLQSACEPQPVIDSTGDESELSAIEKDFFFLFMDIWVRPWICDQHRQAANPNFWISPRYEREGSLNSFQRYVEQYIEAIQADRRSPDISIKTETLLTFMSRLNPKNNFAQDSQALIQFARDWNHMVFASVQEKLNRQVQDHSVALYPYVDMLRIESTLQQHAQSIEKYQRILKSHPNSPLSPEQLTLSPQAVGELFTHQRELEDFSETSIDTQVDQLRGNLMVHTREAIRSYSVAELYADILKALEIPRSYEEVAESLLPEWLGLTPELRANLGFGDQTLPWFLSWVRSKVMSYVQDRLVMAGGMHHRLQQTLISNTLRVEVLMRIILGGAELSPSVPQTWARPPQTPAEEQQHRQILMGLLQMAQQPQDHLNEAGLRQILDCFERDEQDWIRLQSQSEGCQAFRRHLEKGFQQLDWLMYFYDKFFDAHTLALFSQDAFERHPGLGKIVVKAQRPSTPFTADQAPRRIYFSQEKNLRPFERRRDGKALERSLFFSARMNPQVPLKPWRQLDQLYEQVMPCATDHWCMIWRPQVYMKVIQEQGGSTEIMPSPWGMPGVVQEVKIEEVIPGHELYDKTIEFFLSDTLTSRKPTFLFKITSVSQSPDIQNRVILEQMFLVYAQDARYDMMSALSVTLSHNIGGQVSTDVKFVSSPVPFSYVHLYGLSDGYRVSAREGIDTLMRDFVDGFQISYAAPDFVSEVYRKKWMPFSHLHTWSKDGQKMSVNAGGIVLVLDRNRGLVFRSDGPDHMGTRYLRSGIDGLWHHHPYDQFPYGQFSGVRAPKHDSLLFRTQSVGSQLGTWLWDSITNFGIQTGQDFGRFYDPQAEAFVIKRRVRFDMGDNDFVDESVTDTRSWINVIPHIKMIPTLPHHLSYTPPGMGYAQRVEKLAYEHNVTLSQDPGVVELFQQPELQTLFASGGKEIWVLSHLPIDKFYRAPNRTYLSHIDLRSSQRHPHLVNVMSYAEAEGTWQFPNLSEWLSKRCDELPQGVCDHGFLKGLWLAARQSVGGGLQGFNVLDEALQEAPYFRYQPRIRSVALGEGEGVFVVTVFPYDYERMMERHRKTYGEVGETGEVAWPSMMWSPSDYAERLAEETQYGKLSERYRQYLLYVRWEVNDGLHRSELSQPGLNIVARHGVELENQVWGKMAFPQRWVPLPDMEVIDGMVLVGGTSENDPPVRSSGTQTQNADQMYEAYVQNKLIASYDWDPESGSEPFTALSNIDQFGQDFQVKEVFDKGLGCFDGNPWTHPDFRLFRDRTLSRRPQSDDPISLHALPILAASTTVSEMVVDFQQRCLHPKFRAQGSGIYSDQGCVCQVKIPLSLLAEGTSARAPLQFTYYRWGFAKDTQQRWIPPELSHELVTELRLLQSVLGSLWTYAPEGRTQPIAEEGGQTGRVSGAALSDVLFGEFGEKVLCVPDALRECR